MKCQLLFSVKNKENKIHLSSAELAQRVVKVHNKHGSRQAYFLFENIHYEYSLELPDEYHKQK